MQAAEHILLESGEREVPTRETARRIHARVLLRGGRWRPATELALIDDCFLSVRVTRAQSIVARYVVDLRFVDPLPRLERRVAWSWLAVGFAMLALGIAGAREVAAAGPWWRHEWLFASAALLVFSACVLYVALHRTTETLALISTRGQATVVMHTGLLGSFRKFRKFLPWLDAQLQSAATAHGRSRTETLRDEMREHFRLRAAGVLADADYENAKRRILALHDAASDPRRGISPPDRSALRPRRASGGLVPP